MYLHLIDCEKLSSITDMCATLHGSEGYAPYVVLSAQIETRASTIDRNDGAQHLSSKEIVISVVKHGSLNSVCSTCNALFTQPR